RRVTGLSFDFDAMLFDVPYIGLETFIANLAAFNVVGGRVYTRPLAWSGIPILDTAQLGFTVAADLHPFYYEEQDFKALLSPQDDSEVDYQSPYASFWDDKDHDSDASNDSTDQQVVIYGVDLRVPILSSDIISLAAFSDFVIQNE